MILNFFKNSQPVTYLLVPLFMGLAWAAAQHAGGPLVAENPMPLYNLVASMATAIPVWLAGVLGCALATFQAFHLNYIISKHEVLYKNSYLPALFYLLFLAIIPAFLSIHPVLLVNSIMLLVVDKLFRIYKNPSPLPLVFDSFFLISVASLIYLPALTFVLLAIMAVLILKTFSWRDWMVGLTGLALPFFFMFIYYFWVEGLSTLNETFLLHRIRELWDPRGLILQGYRITLAATSVLFVLTVFRIRQHFYKNATRIRNFQQVVFLFFGVGLLSLAFTAKSLALYRFSIITIPYSIMVSYYFLAARKLWWTEFLFWSLVAIMVFNYLSQSGIS